MHPAQLLRRESKKVHRTVQVGGKLDRRQPTKLAATSATPQVIAMATAMSFPTGSGLIFLKDQISGKDFLVDTEASLSILPHKSIEPPSGPKLSGANGLPIPACGVRGQIITLSISACRCGCTHLGFGFFAQVPLRCVTGGSLNL